MRSCNSAVGRWKATCSLLLTQSFPCFARELRTLMKEKQVADSAVFLNNTGKEHWSIGIYAVMMMPPAS